MLSSIRSPHLEPPQHAVKPLARADLDFAVAAREQHDHAVVFALLADAPCVDEVGGVIRRVLPSRKSTTTATA